MSQDDIAIAIKAFRFTCPHGTRCRHLDGTVSIVSCFGLECKKHDYKCGDRVCKRLREFINILKEPRE